MTARDEWRWTDERGIQRLVGTDELRAALASSLLPANTLVWREGMKEWAPASTMPELAGAARDARPRPIDRSGPPAPDPSRARTPTRRPAPPAAPPRPATRTLLGVTVPEASAPAPPADVDRPAPQRKMTTREIDGRWSSPGIDVESDEDATLPQLVRPSRASINDGELPANGASAPRSAFTSTLLGQPAAEVPNEAAPASPAEDQAPKADAPKAEAPKAEAPRLPVAAPRLPVAAPRVTAPTAPKPPPIASSLARPAPHRPPVATRPPVPKAPVKPPLPVAKSATASGVIPPSSTAVAPLSSTAVAPLSSTAVAPLSATAPATAQSPEAAPEPSLAAALVRPDPEEAPAPIPPAPRIPSIPPPLPEPDIAPDGFPSHTPPPAVVAPVDSTPAVARSDISTTLLSPGQFPIDPPLAPPPARAAHSSHPPPRAAHLSTPPARPSTPPPLPSTPPPLPPVGSTTAPLALVHPPRRATSTPPAAPLSQPPPRPSNAPPPRPSNAPPAASTSQPPPAATPSRPPPKFGKAPPLPEMSGVAVPVSSLYGTGGVLIAMVVTAFFAGRYSAKPPPMIAHSMLHDLPLRARAAIPAPLKPCFVTRQPVMWAPKVSKSIPFEVTPTAAGSLAVGYALDSNAAAGLEVTPRTGEAVPRFDQKAKDDIERVSALPSGEFRVVTSGGTLASLLPVAGPSPFVLGVQNGALSVADREDATASPLWPLTGGEGLGAARVQIAGDKGYGLTFRRDGSIWAGWIGADRKASGALTKVIGSGGALGKPNSGWNRKELAVIFADKPPEHDHYEIRIGHAPSGSVPAATTVFPLPKGGPGGDAFAPDLAGLPDGRWLMIWTEGAAGSRAIRAQTLAPDFTPLGDPIALSPPAGNFGQGVLGVAGGGYAAAVFLSKGSSSYELWGSILQCG